MELHCTYPGCKAQPETVGEVFEAQYSLIGWRCEVHEGAPRRVQTLPGQAWHLDQGKARRIV
jgi:hypothetical protein